MPPGALSRPNQTADERNRAARIGQLITHQHHQAETEEEEQEAGDGVLDADHLVIDREDVLPPEAELLVRLVVSMSMSDVPNGRCVVHFCLSRGPVPRSACVER